MNMKSLTYPKNVSVLKYKNNILGFEHRTKNYIIGFQQKKHAIIVHNNICTNSINNIMLLRYYIENVSDEVNTGLKLLGVDNINTDISIDLEASLIIPKRKVNKNYNEDITIEDLNFEKFLMYPFDKNIGISLPFTLEENTDDKFIFTAQVIDPCDNIDIFRKNLII